MIRKERRNGRDKIIVPSATLPDNVVMNGIMYPADEIEGSAENGTGFRTLNGKLAPLGHPMVGGMFVSAAHPEGLNAGWIGAHNENVRRENGRVYLDKVIDVARAGESAGGKAVLDAIEKGEPIHTSTGLIGELRDNKGDGYDYTIHNLQFDHDAILLGEEGAATPAQGVGMLVNAAGETKEIEVVNSALDAADNDLEWAADMAVRAIEKMGRAPLIERIKSAIMDAVKGTSGRETSATNGEAEMTVSKEQFDELSAKVNALTEATSAEALGKAITDAVANAVKPLTDNLAEMKANQEAKDKAELAGLVEKIVKANILDEEAAKELTLNAARKLAEKAKPGKAAALNGAFTGNADDEFAGYSLNGEKKEAVQ